MNYRLIIREEAEHDVDEAAEWYERRREGLGVEFTAELRSRFTRIRENPFQFAAAGKRARRALLDRFPYAIYFKVAGDLVEVVAVMHARRNSRHWRRRL